jgi:hypothetical protein
MKNKTQIFNTVKVIILAFVLATGLQYVAAQSWSAPTGSPPGNNTYAPINEGTSGQIKYGGLTVGAGTNPVPTIGLKVENGNFYVQSGLAGIGSTNLTSGVRMTVASDLSDLNTLFTSGRGASYIQVKSGNGSNLVGVNAGGPWIGGYETTLPLSFKVNDAIKMSINNSGIVEIPIPGQLKIPSGAGANKVLTSDASGNASWQPVGAPATPTTVMAEYSTVDESHNPPYVFPQGFSNRIASCPSGKVLVSCTGGMVREGVGDADDNEAHLIVPNTSNNSCTIYYESDPGDAITARVYAFCM